MSESETIVIVGAGQAGGVTAAALRREGFAGRVVIVGDETYVPYERPPLSKKVLMGLDDVEATYLMEAEAYAEQDVHLMLGVRAEAIDRQGRQVALSDGETLAYDKLVLATGSRVRRLSLPGARPTDLLYLRDMNDSLALRDRLGTDVRVVVIGGGYIGLEVAAAARVRDCRVTVLEAQDGVMNRVVAPEVGEFFAQVHRDRGVDIRTGVSVTGLVGDAGARAVRLGDGTEVPADVIVVGIGIVPNVELAEGAGLDVENGIVVDEHGRTSDADIYAAGDVTNHPNALLGRRVRLESWQNAQNQAIAVAKALAGKPEAYGEVPWFWSDQYDINLQMAGLPERWDRLVYRGDVAAHKFTVFYLAGDRVVAGNTVNNARDMRPVRQLIADARPVDATALADPETSLRTLLA